ncbi:unnamed protein product, partial [marine sediment metagenome]
MRTATRFKRSFDLKDTSCTIISDQENAIDAAVSSIRNHRRQLEEYVEAHPLFLDSLRPVTVKRGPEVVELMAEAARKSNVGPIAAVAGVLADLAVKEMHRTGSEVAVIENGGEISAISNEPIDVA